MMVGAEGFEASFPSGHYAVFLVGFNSKTSLHQGTCQNSLACPSFPILSPMDKIPQEFGITGIIPPSSFNLNAN